MIRTLTAIAAVLAIAGCGTSPKPRFYTLSPQPAVAGAPTGTAASDRPRILVGPVMLPDAVNRPQLVTRVGANEVAIEEQHRWAGPLKDEVPRILAADLERLTRNPRLTADPFAAATAVDYRLTVDFQRFEGVVGDDVTLDASWTVLHANGDVVSTGRSVLHEPAGAPGYDALTAAYSRALAKLADSIAPALNALPAIKH
jgi:uncharacterized lipoprotein YmbA